MPSLGQLYNDKESGLTTRKTYNVPIASIYAEEGYNVRELNQAHVDEFRDAFIAGEYIPPLAVEVTERGVKVIDGHHRYHGALAAIATRFANCTAYVCSMPIFSAIYRCHQLIAQTWPAISVSINHGRNQPMHRPAKKPEPLYSLSVSSQ